ncbi:hypothetical protein COCCADRAFT_104377 [Bipolaris zeicola 26-R-13]|uniref:Uncharacterized protein n=1 Tax=Cochliobolus carbonum (strain 26-R-13) TaxID=930089 RepID=W6YG98_COCC2|nr:uncharacterized protein COCCADRAFT_104377 [Bipolaris zeicola 26-R-13]EUC30241.1 hypothetical protein COCCADRAFT_104377 [Bipolaris zeicola 26-R-13]
MFSFFEYLLRLVALWNDYKSASRLSGLHRQCWHHIIIISSERREKKELYTICCCYYYCVEWILIVPGLHVHGGWCLERAWLEDGSWQATPEKRLSWTKSSVRCGSWRGSNG